MAVPDADTIFNSLAVSKDTESSLSFVSARVCQTASSLSSGISAVGSNSPASGPAPAAPAVADHELGEFATDREGRSGPLRECAKPKRASAPGAPSTTPVAKPAIVEIICARSWAAVSALVEHRLVSVERRAVDDCGVEQPRLVGLQFRAAGSG